MHEFLYTIGEYLILINILVLFAYQFVAPDKSSFGAILTIVVLMQMLQMWYEHFLIYSLAETFSKESIRIFWYMGFAVIDFAAVKICVSYCSYRNMTREKAGNFILLSVLLLGVMQLARFADRILIESNMLGWVYKHMIPTFNFGITFAATAYVAFIITGKIHNHLKEQ